MWGIQGFDISLMVDKITKYSTLVQDPNQAIYELEKAYHIAGDERPGPVWIDYPMDIQSKNIPVNDLTHFTFPKKFIKSASSAEIQKVLSMIELAERPIFWLGHGIRLSGSVDKITPLLEKYKFPTLVSWAGLDMLNDNHLLNYGRAGVYGNTRSQNYPN